MCKVPGFLQKHSGPTLLARIVASKSHTCFQFQMAQNLTQTYYVKIYTIFFKINIRNNCFFAGSSGTQMRQRSLPFCWQTKLKILCMDTPITNMPVTYAPLIKAWESVWYSVSPKELQNVKNLGYIKSYNINYYVGIKITQELFIYMVYCHWQNKAIKVFPVLAASCITFSSKQLL